MENKLFTIIFANADASDEHRILNVSLSETQAIMDLLMEESGLAWISEEDGSYTAYQRTRLSDGSWGNVPFARIYSREQEGMEAIDLNLT